jgi:hypothetical protein
MFRLFAWFVVLLVVLGCAYAATDTYVPPPSTVTPGSVQTAGTDQANRYLSAELTKQMDARFELLQKGVNDNIDSNYAVMDQRILGYIQDERQRVILIGIGTMMVANALIGLFLIRAWRRYSYEYYQEQIIKKYQAQEQEMGPAAYADEYRGLQQMQQEAYYPQQPTETIGMQVGSTEAMNMSQMNAWQMQPAREGSWVPPQQGQRYNPYEGGNNGG